MTQQIDMIPLGSVRIDRKMQSRVELNEATIAEYTEGVRASAEFPPVVTFFDGASFWLADGFHRFHAHRNAMAMEIQSDIRTGNARDAILYSVGANATHGLRRTNDDKRRAVQTMLDDAEWSTWSDRDIAKQCGVSHPFVAAVRSPSVVVRQQEQRHQSAAAKLSGVESDSTPRVGQKMPHTPVAPRLAPPVVAARGPEPAPGPVEIIVDEPVDTPEPESEIGDVTELREKVAELSELLQSTLADNEMMGRVFDADDQIKAAMAEATRQRAIAENAERTLIAKNGEFVERARAVTYWQNRATKAEKALEKLEPKT